jgi:hypothetical protein
VQSGQRKGVSNLATEGGQQSGPHPRTVCPGRRGESATVIMARGRSASEINSRRADGWVADANEHLAEAHLAHELGPVLAAEVGDAVDVAELVVVSPMDEAADELSRGGLGDPWECCNVPGHLVRGEVLLVLEQTKQ